MEAGEMEKSLLKEFADWVKEEKISEDVDPDILLNFLYGCKYRLNKAKDKYKHFAQLRESTPEWFDDRDPNLEELQVLLNLGVCVVLREKDEKDRTSVVVRVAIHDPKAMPLAPYFKLNFMIVDYLLATNSDIWKYGMNFIIDGQGTSLALTFQYTPFIIKKLVYMWMQCIPVRFKSFNFINIPFMAQFLIKLMKNFMPQKLRDRVYVHSNYEELHQIVSPNILPKEYGGTNGEIEALQKVWSERIIKNREWFLNHMKKSALNKDIN